VWITRVWGRREGFAERRGPSLTPAQPLSNDPSLQHRVEERAEQEAWAAGLAEALSGGARTDAYVGFMGEGGKDDVRRAYPPTTLKRLGQVKRRYDPDNLFHLNLNVAPDMG